MSNVFEDVPLTWEGVTYTIPSNRIMGAIARIEDVMTLHELSTIRDPRKIKLSHLAQAYGTALRYAGCKVSDEEVYTTMFGKGDIASVAQSIVLGLLVMMTPPSIGKAEVKRAASNPTSGGEQSSQSASSSPSTGS